MAKKTIEFKTESKRLLELMIHSIYTNKEIFLRELISNASDAIDKYHLMSLTDESLEKRNDYEIHLEVDKKHRKLKISDNGIGMTYDELIENIGTIAKSGTLDFLKNMKEKELKDDDLIGQFGVGFYSAFMVSSKVEVITKSAFSNQAYKWISKGENGFTIEETEKDSIGTEIILTIRKNEDEEEYDEFLEEYKIRSLVKKYSDYVKYPITMEHESQVPLKDEEGNEIEGMFETKVENETLNSMTPIWKKNKSEVKDEELNEFYKTQYYDYNDPLFSIWTNVEGALTYKSIVFIPEKAPQNLYSEKYEKGLQLYAKGVFVMDKCKELVPDYLRFIKGLVVSPDLNLNISREILQQNRQLVLIQKNLEKKIINELEKTLKNEREKYLNNCVGQILEEVFPPQLPNLKHMVINSQAQSELKKRGFQSTIMPNIFDFDAPLPEIDDFNLNLKSELGLNANDLFFLQPTRVIPRKGIELAIELVHQLSDLPIKLIISHNAELNTLDYLSDLFALAALKKVDLRYLPARFLPYRVQGVGIQKKFSL
ncbi:MAG: molecular chaperone HtpG, partial [Tenericutes bacterium HGW-Tenericutes-5]